jgi:hypothetical protein
MDAGAFEGGSGLVESFDGADGHNTYEISVRGEKLRAGQRASRQARRANRFSSEDIHLALFGAEASAVRTRDQTRL